MTKVITRAQGVNWDCRCFRVQFTSAFWFGNAMSGQKAHVFTGTDGTVVPLHINIMTIDRWKPSPSPDFTTPTIIIVIVPYYRITRFSASNAMMSPSTTVYVIGPASFNIILNTTEVPVTLPQ